MEPLTFRRAGPGDAAAVAALINSAYRGESSKAGWTTEADFLEGQRTDEDEIAALVAGEGSVILLCELDGRIVGTVHLQRHEQHAYLGMLVVEPVLQARGTGKRIVHAAEMLVREEWRLAHIMMTVLTVRHELLAFYERRGYRRTGKTRPFPEEALSTPKVGGLEFEELEKDLT